MLTFVAGTRPEVIKIGPVAASLAASRYPYHVLLTGQHTSLLSGTPVASDLGGAASLGVPSDGRVARWMHTVESELQRRWRREKPRMVVVQGDTMSGLAAARVADRLHIPVAHIEAGVRSHDLENPWPEERSRVEIDGIAKWHLAATETAAAQLRAEGYPTPGITVTGNTVVSALARYAPDVRPVRQPLPRVVITLHRREVQRKTTITALYEALCREAWNLPDLSFLWPLHPAVEQLLAVRGPEPPNLWLVRPLAHEAFLATLASSAAFLTDSGGGVEEAATLGVPTMILRQVNDRPEAVAAGIAKVFDPTPDGLREALAWFPCVPRRPVNVFGNVDAADRVAKRLMEVA